MSKYDRARDERNALRAFNVGAAALAVFMVWVAILALRATFGW